MANLHNLRTWKKYLTATVKILCTSRVRLISWSQVNFTQPKHEIWILEAEEGRIRNMMGYLQWVTQSTHMSILDGLTFKTNSFPPISSVKFGFWEYQRSIIWDQIRNLMYYSKSAAQKTSASVIHSIMPIWNPKIYDTVEPVKLLGRGGEGDLHHLIRN